MTLSDANLSDHDRLLLQRHVDGELDGPARAAFAARLAAEPELARAATAAQGLRDLFAAGRADVRRAPASFAADVVAAVRRLPSREQLEQAEVAGGAVALCRRLLLAAVILAGLGLAWHSGLVQLGEPEHLQAAPGDVARAIERLDALPEPPAAPAAATTNRGR